MRRERETVILVITDKKQQETLSNKTMKKGE